MSEKEPILHNSQETKSERVEANHHKERQEHLKQLEKEGKKAEKSHDDIEKIKSSIETTAISGKETSVGEREKPKTTHSFGINKELKESAYKRTVKKARSKLSTPERSFSKIIHNNTVEKISAVSAATVARPSGFLFGSILAFVSAVVLLFISKRSGFEYNYLIFLLVFAGGYIIGIVLELFYKSFRKK